MRDIKADGAIDEDRINAFGAAGGFGVTRRETRASQCASRGVGNGEKGNGDGGIGKIEGLVAPAAPAC